MTSVADNEEFSGWQRKITLPIYPAPMRPVADPKGQIGRMHLLELMPVISHMLAPLNRSGLSGDNHGRDFRALPEKN